SFMTHLQPSSPLFPYTTLFRSKSWIPVAACAGGKSIVISAKMNRWDRASSKVARVRPPLSTLTPTRGSRINVKPFTVRLHINPRSEEHTSELQSRGHLVCRLLL